MADRFTEVRETGFLQNLVESIKGVVVGLLLFLVSFVVLWWNEGRTDWSEVAEKSTPISAETVERGADGEFVSVTGELKSEESLSDPGFLDYGPYLSLDREVEMFAWVEDTSRETRKKLGGKKVTETTYSYEKEWTDDPPDSGSFREPQGHDNPSPAIEDKSFVVQRAAIGAYSFHPDSVTWPRPSPVQISRSNFVPSPEGRLEKGYIFSGDGTLSSPEIGDLRISYRAVRSGTRATLFGKLEGESITPYFHKGNKKFYRALAGPREEAIARLATERRVTTWLLRGAGFLMMWIGLCLFFGPINAALDFIPILGSVGRSIIGLAMFAVALGLSFLTILVSMIAHNFLMLMATVTAVIVAVWGVGRVRRERLAKAYAPAGSAQPPAPEAGPARPPRDEEAAMREAMQQTGAAPRKIRFECEECGKRYTVDASLAGRKARCKECGHKFYLPSGSGAEP